MIQRGSEPAGGEGKAGGWSDGDEWGNKRKHVIPDELWQVRQNTTVYYKQVVQVDLELCWTFQKVCSKILYNVT